MSVTFRDNPSRRAGQQLERIVVIRNTEADTVRELLTHLAWVLANVRIVVLDRGKADIRVL